MKKVPEIKRSIRLMISYPSTFGYSDFGDHGNTCSGRLDRMNELENIDYAESYAAVLIAMPKYSELHKQFAPVLAKELGLKQWPRYDYMVKLIARILGDDDVESSETVEQMCLFASRVQRYMKNTGKTEITERDLENI